MSIIQDLSMNVLIKNIYNGNTTNSKVIENFIMQL
jgi:hypothetical protein